ncbi:DegV family protein [Bacillus sp. FJAT-45350]|uniref:DegV family protein n=1 Tax=Bacillus sp. FJAT-45350 TaxID=2011014 RepID=UPI000BB7E15A|nr:DegV family protein [Bacillus sp. FJAT-45350]
MSRIAIVTDSTAYLSVDEIDKLEVKVVPLSVVFGEEAFKEEVDISTEQFYEKMKTTDKLSTTTQPAIGAFVEMYESLAKEGYDAVISIHLSSGISGTFQTAVSAASMVEGIDVHCFDSEVSCSPQGYYVYAAAKLIEEERAVDEILVHLDAMRINVRAYFMVDDLNHLHRGGRLNTAQLFVGSLLKIKPVLNFEKKVIVPFEKVRTEKKALSRILGMLDEDMQKDKPPSVITVIHGNRKDKAEEIIAELHTKYGNDVDIQISYFGPVIGTHLGQGSIGISWCNQ